MKKAIFLASLVAVSASSFAESKKAGSGPNPFSDCGIGAALFSENKALAVTSNVIWDVGTTAVTSATASPETCQGKETTAAKFIIESYDSIAEDTARGEGQHLNALLDIMQVSQADKATVIAKLRSNMASAVSNDSLANATANAKSEAYYQALVAAI